jgi:hypothetical protein
VHRQLHVKVLTFVAGLGLSISLDPWAIASARDSYCLWAGNVTLNYTAVSRVVRHIHKDIYRTVDVKHSSNTSGTSGRTTLCPFSISCYNHSTLAPLPSHPGLNTAHIGGNPPDTEQPCAAILGFLSPNTVVTRSLWADTMSTLCPLPQH